MRVFDFEAARLKALHELDILDSDPEPGFDAITKLAAQLFQTPVSTISLIDSERAWFKSTVGVDHCETPRDASFCAYAVHHSDVTIVLDAARDPRFADHPAVTGEAHIRFYAGAPVKFDGVIVGILCVADRTTRPVFSERDAETIRSLADAVSSMMAMRKDGLIKKEIIRTRNESQRKLEMMEAAAGVGYWHVELATQQVQWSKGLYKILGLSPDNHAPRLDEGEDWYHPDDWARMHAGFAQALRDGKPYGVDARLYRRDGGERIVRVEGAAAFGEDGKPASVFGIYQDITEQKHVEDTLRAARCAAEAYAQAQSDFLSNMSHEIRTPLTVILGFSDLLWQSGAVTGSERKYTDRILKNSKMLLSLVNDILDYAKFEAGEVTLDPRPTDLRNLIADVCDQFVAQAEARGTVLAFDYAEDCPADFHIDEVRLTQVFNNLIGNACKFTEGGTVSVSISARAGGEGYRLRGSVRDTGKGIAADKMDRLFKRFSQTDRGVHRQHGGTGLGLAICEEIIHLMHGEIGVESKDGEGSCFWFEIPVVEAEVVEPDLALQYGEAIRGKHILMVDDNPATRDMIGQILEDIGAVVTPAASGAEAIERCGAGGFDAILMDIHMPGIDGIQAAQRIRDAAPAGRRTPIIALTADTASNLAGLPMFDAILYKPLRHGAFLQVLSTACGT